MAAAIRTLLMPVANRVRDAGFTRLTRDRVIAPFACGDSDRMNRRKIDDVETHLPRVVDPWKAIAKSGTAIGSSFCGAREKLVPLREKCALAIHANQRIFRMIALFSWFDFILLLNEGRRCFLLCARCLHLRLVCNPLIASCMRLVADNGTPG